MKQQKYHNALNPTRKQLLGLYLVCRLQQYSTSIYLIFLILAGQFPIRLLAQDTNNYQIIVTSNRSNSTSNNQQNKSDKNLNTTDLSHTKKTDLSDSVQYLPGLTYSGGTTRPRFLQIRGIGERELYEGIPNYSVTTIYDGFDFSGIGGGVSMFDVDQISLKMGPQSFMYGPPSLAGTVQISTAEPTSIDNGFAEINIGTNEFLTGGFAVGGPLNKQKDLRYRIAVYQDRINGFRRNTFLDRDDTNHRDTQLARFKLSYDYSSTTTVDTLFLFSGLDDGYDAFTIDNNFTTESDRPGVDIQKSYGAQLKITNALPGEGKLINTFSYLNSALHQSFDADWGNPILWHPNNPYDYAQDLRRKPEYLAHDARWISNGFDPLIANQSQITLAYYGARYNDDADIQDSSDGQVYRSGESRYHLWQFSPSINLAHSLAPKWVIETGLRLEQRRLGFNDTREDDYSNQENLVTGAASLKKYLSKNEYLYLSASRGEKGGGVNPGLSIPEGKKSFEAESLWNFESGVKQNFLDDTLKTNFSIFYGYRDSQQVRVSSQEDPTNPATFSLYTDNAATGNMYGVDAEAIWKATPSLRLRLNGELLQTNIYDYQTATGSLNGRQQANAPNWSYSASVDYTLTQRWYVGSRISGKDRIYFDDSHNQTGSAYNLVDGHIGYQANNWSVEFWGKNIFDKEYAVRGFYFGNEPPDFQNKRYVQLGDPVWFGVTVRYDW